MGKQYTDGEKTAARTRLDSTVVRFRRDIEIEIERAAEILGHDVEELRREYSGGIQTGVSLLRKLKTQTDGAHLLRGSVCTSTGSYPQYSNHATTPMWSMA